MGYTDYAYILMPVKVRVDFDEKKVLEVEQPILDIAREFFDPSDIFFTFDDAQVGMARLKGF